MDPAILKTVGQVAGLAGISLGVVLILFRNVIQKNIFASLTKPQSFRLLVLLLVLVWSLAIFGIGAWVWVTLDDNAKRNGEGPLPTAPAAVTQLPPPVPENFPDLESSGFARLTDEDRKSQFYAESRVYVENKTKDTIRLAYSFAPKGSEEDETRISRYGHILTELVLAGEVLEDVRDKFGGPVHLSVFAGGQWYPMNEWFDLRVVEHRTITVMRSNGSFSCTVGF